METKLINFFKFLEDKEGQRAPLRIKLLNPKQFEITPEELIVKGDLDLSYIKITSLPDGLEVEGNLYLSGTLITSLPNGLKVGGDLDLPYTEITSLPKDLKVEGDLYLNDTPLSFKTRAEIRQMAPNIKGGIIGLKT